MEIPDQPVRVHRHPLSGHSHRVELFLSILGIPAQLVNVDIPGRAHKSPEFLAKNPFGLIPVLEDGDVVLADSNAILVYLAKRYDDSRRWYPDEPVAAAQIQGCSTTSARRPFRRDCSATRFEGAISETRKWSSTMVSCPAASRTICRRSSTR